eukprot:m.41203 g.41203  ORF g.41203 m.41203 type:complete len:445 (-) comp5657_c1_seq2:510-1844(-)
MTSRSATTVTASAPAPAQAEVTREDLQRRLEADRRALEASVALARGCTPAQLVEMAPFLTQKFYAGIVEDRAEGQRVCGYPLCARAITAPPAEAFRFRRGKMYDIKETKCFCCNFCYAASRHLAAQLSDMPAGFVHAARTITLLTEGGIAPVVAPSVEKALNGLAISERTTVAPAAPPTADSAQAIDGYAPKVAGLPDTVSSELGAKTTAGRSADAPPASARPAAQFKRPTTKIPHKKTVTFDRVDDNDEDDDLFVDQRGGMFLTTGPGSAIKVPAPRGAQPPPPVATRAVQSLGDLRALMASWITPRTRQILCRTGPDSNPNQCNASATELDTSAAAEPFALPPVDGIEQARRRHEVFVAQLEGWLAAVVAAAGIQRVVVEGSLLDLVDSFDLHSDSTTLSPPLWLVVCSALVSVLQPAVSSRLRSFIQLEDAAWTALLSVFA